MAAIGYGRLAFGRVVVGIAGKAGQVHHRRMPNGWRANLEPSELEIGHQPGRRLAIRVMMVGAGIGAIVGIRLNGRALVVGVRIDIAWLLGCAMIVVRLVIELQSPCPRICGMHISKLVLDDSDGHCGRLGGQKQHERRAKHGDPLRKSAPCARHAAPPQSSPQ